MNAALDDRTTLVQARGGSTARRVLAGALMPLATVLVVVAGLRVPPAGGISSLQAVAFGLVLVGAL